MKLRFSSWTDFHHQIYRIYHGIIALTLVPFFLLFLELEVARVEEPRVASTIVYGILLVFVPGCGYLSWLVWRGQVFRYREYTTLKAKLEEFRRVEILKYLLLELVCVIGLAGLWLTSHYFFIIVYFSVLVQFSFLRPSEDRFVRCMQVTKEERKRLHEEEL